MRVLCVTKKIKQTKRKEKVKTKSSRVTIKIHKTEKKNVDTKN